MPSFFNIGYIKFRLQRSLCYNFFIPLIFIQFCSYTFFYKPYSFYVELRHLYNDAFKMDITCPTLNEKRKIQQV